MHLETVERMKDPCKTRAYDAASRIRDRIEEAERAITTGTIHAAVYLQSARRYPEEIVMTYNDDGQPPVENVGLPEENGASIVEQASDGIKQAAHGVGVVYEKARKPGMPLSILSNIAREAPLGSLLVAFLLGVAVARRR